MNKKGQEHPFFFSFEIIIGIIVTILFISIATNVDSISKANKLYAQEDIKLLAETIQAAPGAIQYSYRIKSLYTINVKEEDIEIRENQNIFAGYQYYNLTFKKEQGSETTSVEKNA